MTRGRRVRDLSSSLLFALLSLCECVRDARSKGYRQTDADVLLLFLSASAGSVAALRGGGTGGRLGGGHVGMLAHAFSSLGSDSLLSCPV
mmetsp:Transcript_16030/g.32506  ORF Transcript_16030/g.32506 Transcript_16030/m.32506 type:complete len:90 (+) Transcript_16030:492-761(+)